MSKPALIQWAKGIGIDLDPEKPPEVLLGRVLKLAV